MVRKSAVWMLSIATSIVCGQTIWSEPEQDPLSKARFHEALLVAVELSPRKPPVLAGDIHVDLRVRIEDGHHLHPLSRS